MKYSFIAKYILYLFIGLAILSVFDLRKVNLVLIGSIPIENINKSQFDKPGNYLVQACFGSKCANAIKDNERWLGQYQINDIIINTKKIKFEPNAFYYYSIGCQIKSIFYFKHSKFVNSFFNKDNVYEKLYESVSLSSQRNVIYVYKGNVSTVAHEVD